HDERRGVDRLVGERGRGRRERGHGGEAGDGDGRRRRSARAARGARSRGRGVGSTCGRVLHGTSVGPGTGRRAPFPLVTFRSFGRGTNPSGASSAEVGRVCQYLDQNKQKRATSGLV